MTDKPVVKLFLILALATLACGLASPASDSPLPVLVQETVLAPTVSTPNLSIDQLKNAQYQLGARDDHAVVQLSDGIYQQGTDFASVDYISAVLTDFISFGDLSGDGINEAAVIVYENFGGTGNFGFLTIYTNVNGLPVFLTSIMIDDRPMINNIAVENSEVYLDAIIHGFEDPGCCPALATTRKYALVNNQMRLTNYTTATPEGKKREIVIESPVTATESTGSVQVSGTVSIAPFENNLSYFIYDEVGNQLAAGPVTVTAPDLGAPGTFGETISLANIPAGTTIYLEIQDISVADGSLFALDVVKLTMK